MAAQQNKRKEIKTIYNTPQSQLIKELSKNH